MSIARYTPPRLCTWEGCHTVALPGCPNGAEFCAQHIDQGTQHILQLTQRINASTTPTWRKPGRWVPVVLFVLWLAATAYYPTMLLWWVIFIPIAAFGWHFGMGAHKPSRN